MAVERLLLETGDVLLLETGDGLLLESSTAGAGAGLTTRDRRASAHAIDLLGLRVLPNPDGTISTADRLHLLGKYRAVGATDGGAAAAPGMYKPIFRGRRR